MHSKFREIERKKILNELKTAGSFCNASHQVIMIERNSTIYQCIYQPASNLPEILICQNVTNFTIFFYHNLVLDNFFISGALHLYEICGVQLFQKKENST